MLCSDVPEELLTDLDIENIYKRWVERTPVRVTADDNFFKNMFANEHTDVKDTLRLRLSEDAGHYLCDFMYFSSLAHLYKQQRAKRVLFFHVPLHADEESVSRGKELVLELIRSICEAGLRKGVM